MNGREFLAEQFEQHRSRLRAVAFRILGSVSEADDAVQETWLRLSRSEAEEIGNLGGWLTTVVARICLDMLRSRNSRREELLDEGLPEPSAERPAAGDPESEALLADSVGIALLVVLDRLEPAERLAFVLHDIFGVGFEEIGGILGRSPAATRQLASRARRKVRGTKDAVPASTRRQQQEVARRFLTALRAGDLPGLVAVLDPDLVVHVDEFAARPEVPRVIRGAETWAKSAIVFSRTARATEALFMDDSVGFVWAPGGRLRRAVKFTIANGRVAEIEIIGDPERLRELNLAVFHDV